MNFFGKKIPTMTPSDSWIDKKYISNYSNKFISYTEKNLIKYVYLSKFLLRVLITRSHVDHKNHFPVIFLKMVHFPTGQVRRQLIKRCHRKHRNRFDGHIVPGNIRPFFPYGRRTTRRLLGIVEFPGSIGSPSCMRYFKGRCLKIMRRSGSGGFFQRQYRGHGGTVSNDRETRRRGRGHREYLALLCVLVIIRELISQMLKMDLLYVL